MKKKLVVLSIVSLMSVGTIAYASDKSIAPNIEQSNICVEEARTFTRKNDFAKAEKKLNEALKLNNNNADAYYELGIIEAIKNNNNKAINYYTKAIKIIPDRDEYYFSRGLAEAYTLKLKAFIDDMNKVIELNPKSAQAYGSLAITYDRFGNTEKAIEYYDNAIKNDDTSFDLLYVSRAELKVRLKDYDGAIADYNKAIEITKQRNDYDKTTKIEYRKQKIDEIQQAKKIFK